MCQHLNFQSKPKQITKSESQILKNPIVKQIYSMFAHFQSYANIATLVKSPTNKDSSKPNCQNSEIV